MRAYEDYGYLQSRRWVMIRYWRRAWDGHRCRTCANTERRPLQVHHSRYFWKGRFWWIGMLFEFLDCITVCQECHRRLHNNRHIKEFMD